MTFENFEQFQAALFDQVKHMQCTKGKEYTDGIDRFQNFNEEAKDMDVSRLKVAEIFLNKHMRAIKSYIRNGKEYSDEGIMGRIVDAITYLTLIAGMIEETHNNEAATMQTQSSSAYLQQCGAELGRISGMQGMQKGKV